MILAAGLGTRLRPLTDTVPKALVTVSGRTLLAHVVARLQQSGFERIVINVYHRAQQIVDYLEQQHNFGLDLVVSDESGQLLETGGGVKRARRLLNGSSPLLVHNVDIFSNADLSALYASVQHGDDAALLVSSRTTQRYLLFDDDQRLKGWTNVATGQVKSPGPLQEPLSQYRRLAFSGIHVLSPRLFPLMDEWPDRFSIIDFYLSVCGRSRIMAHEQPGLRLLDVGKPDALVEAAHFLQDLGG